MVVDVIHKLASHLCSHKGVGNAILLEIVVKTQQVETHLFRNDIDGGTHYQRSPYLLQTSIETIAGIRTNSAVRLDVLCVVVHVTERHHVSMFQLATLGNTRRATGID